MNKEVFNLDSIVVIIISAVSLIFVAVIGIIVGYFMRKRFAEAQIGSAEKEAENIILEAKKNAEAKKKEILLEAKEESIRTKNEIEKENKERKS